MTFRLTKSKYCKGINCPKALYLSVHHKDLAATPSAANQLRFDEGNDVGALAHKGFPGGILISEDQTQLNEAAERTKTLLQKQSTTAIFEATFIKDEFLCRVDILKSNSDGTWDIYEVKSSKEAKGEHEDDVAFQLWLVELCGIKIRKAFLRHINPDFVSPDWKTFFRDTDLTDIARSKTLSELSQRLKDQLKILHADSVPATNLGPQCSSPYPCEFYDHCHQDVPDGSSLELYRSKKRYEIYYDSHELISEIDPNKIKLTEFQMRQWMASKQEEAIINLEGIKKLLGEVSYPIYFFDFETIAPAIPILNGMASYQRIPVQWSCHVVSVPNSEIIHREYLVDPTSPVDMREQCIRSLKELFKDAVGTIVSYHQSFEKGVIKELADWAENDREELQNILEKFWDLENIFQHHYYHRDMRGSCSIKAVLPHFAPELNYSDLVVQDGGHAEALLRKYCANKLLESELSDIRKDLLRYCERDSLAMVTIWQKLNQIIS